MCIHLVATLHQGSWHLVRAQVLLLENVRFYKEEEKNDIEFAKKVRCMCHSLLLQPYCKYAREPPYRCTLCGRRYATVER